MSKLQIFIVSAFIIVGVSMFVFGERLLPKASTGKPAIVTAFSEESLLKDALLELVPDKSKRITALNSEIKGKTGAEFLELSRQLALAWDSTFTWGASAIYYEKLAITDKMPETWALAGARYLAAYDMSSDSSAQNWLGSKAIACLTQANSMAPENLDFKADLGKAVMLTSTTDPMAGLALLREITAKDPDHLKANLNLAQLSVRSGQTQKAFDRYKKLVQKYPSFSDAYLGLSETSLSLGDTITALNSLKQYKALVKDPAITQQVDIFIKELTKN